MLRVPFLPSTPSATGLPSAKAWSGRWHEAQLTVPFRLNPVSKNRVRPKRASTIGFVEGEIVRLEFDSRLRVSELGWPKIRVLIREVASNPTITRILLKRRLVGNHTIDLISSRQTGMHTSALFKDCSSRGEHLRRRLVIKDFPTTLLRQNGGPRFSAGEDGRGRSWPFPSLLESPMSVASHKTPQFSTHVIRIEVELWRSPRKCFWAVGRSCCADFWGKG